MGRTLDQVVASLPATRQERIESRAAELRDEVEGLRELRLVAGKAQTEIAAALKVKQPAISKIERQTDMYLSTLRNYVEAMGGKLELVVRLPSHAPLRLERLGDLVHGIGAHPAKSATARREKSKPAPQP